MCVLSKPYSPNKEQERQIRLQIQIQKSQRNQKRNEKEHKDKEHKDKEEKAKEEKKHDCAICYNSFKHKDTFVTKCDHAFCHECLSQWFLTKNTCPICRTELSEETENGDDTNNVADVGLTLVLPETTIVPLHVAKESVIRALNLAHVMNYEPDDDEPPMGLRHKWKVQYPSPKCGWRNDFYVYRSSFMNRGINYTIYVEAIHYGHQPQGGSTEHIKVNHVKIHIYTNSSTNEKHLKKTKENTTTNCKSYAIFKNQKTRKSLKRQKNTAQTRQRYNHH